MDNFSVKFNMLVWPSWAKNTEQTQASPKSTRKGKEFEESNFSFTWLVKMSEMVSMKLNWQTKKYVWFHVKMFLKPLTEELW